MKWMQRLVHALSALVMMAALTARAEAVEVSGKIVDPGSKHKGATDFKLVGDTLFAFWGAGAVSADIDLNDFALRIGCGGNKCDLSGVIRGNGTFATTGPANLTLSGHKPNLFSNGFTFTGGTLHLAKPDGVDAIPGNCILGTQTGGVSIAFENSNQINDACHLIVEGRASHCTIDMRGQKETIASLTVKTDLNIDMGEEPSALVVHKVGPTQLATDKAIVIRHFKTGKDVLMWNAEAGGLTPAQLAIIGFVDPSGRDRGTYSARLGTDKQLELGPIVAPVKPPFDLSEKARLDRKKLYDIPGLANLTGKDTPLKAGMKIVSFGDSITMQGRYTKLMGEALSKGQGTQSLGIQLTRHGLNGGRVTDLLAGKSLKADWKATMEELIQKEKPDVVTIWIGVNDVWFLEKGNGTTPEDFEAQLKRVVALCRAVNAKVVLAPVAVLKENAGHWNPKCDQYAEITRKVAKETGSALADLRQAFVAYTQNHGYEILANGTLRYQAAVLAFDGVHINDTGAAIAANLISQAICEALKP